jgi:hypothetical protein
MNASSEAGCVIRKNAWTRLLPSPRRKLLLMGNLSAAAHVLSQLTLIELVHCFGPLDDRSLSCRMRFRGLATVHCRNTSSHASGYGWLCIPSTHAPSDAHQDGQRAERVELRRREAIAWPGAICIRTESRVVVAVLNNGFHGAPTTDFGSPSVWTGYLATGSSTSATNCIIGGVTVLPALHAPHPFV